MIWGPRRPLFGLYSNPMHMFLFWSKFLQHKSNLEASYREVLKQFIGCVSFILFLKEINPEYLLEELMLELKLQCFDHQIWRTDSLEKTIMLGKTQGRRKRGPQRLRWLDDITSSMDMSLSRLQETVKDREDGRHVAVHGVAKSQTWLSNEQKQYFQMIRIWTY